MGAKTTIPFCCTLRGSEECDEPTFVICKECVLFPDAVDATLGLYICGEQLQGVARFK